VSDSIFLPKLATIKIWRGMMGGMGGGPPTAEKPQMGEKEACKQYEAKMEGGQRGGSGCHQ